MQFSPEGENFLLWEYANWWLQTYHSPQTYKLIYCNLYILNISKDEKKRMDSEYGRSEGQKPDNISTISADPKSNVSLNGSNVQAWFPDYRQNGH